MAKRKHIESLQHIAELERELFPENADKPCDERGYHDWIVNEHGTKGEEDYEMWYSCGDCGLITRDEQGATDAI